MKGLIFKDLYTLLKQMKLFIAIMLIWAFIPNFSASLFAIVYASILPVTALAYDERSKWNTLAAMMPYSAKDIVLSKYILGYVFTFVATVFCLIAKLILSSLHLSGSSDNIASIPIVMFVALIMGAVTLPFMFKLGVEKGRFVLIIITIIIVSMATFFSSIFNQFVQLNATKVTVFIGAGTVAVLVNLISIFASIKIYNNAH